MRKVCSLVVRRQGWLLVALCAVAMLAKHGSALASDVHYEYDDYGRLIRAEYDRPNGPIVEYAYDDNGNRLSATTSNVTRGSLRFSASSYSGGEASGVRNVTVQVQRTSGSFGPARVRYTTSNGTAVSGASGDYDAASGELAWEHGDTSAKTFTVSIRDDSNLESTETFSISLSDAVGASLGAPASATISIADNDVDTTPPSAPGTPTFTNISPTQATASWTSATDNVAVTGYRYRLNAGTWRTLSNVTSVNITGLACSVTYQVDVQARDAAGNWSASSSKSFTTADGCAPDAPGAPTFTNITGTSAKATWTAATDLVGVTGYRYRLNSGTWHTLGNVLTVNLSGLSCFTSYTMELQARDAAGNWSASSSNSFTTLDNCAPTAPGTPTASNVSGTSATMSWSAASDNVGVTGYRYRLNGGSWNTLGAVTSKSLTGLSCSTTYTFEIQARDAAGNWGPSSSRSFTTLDRCAPSAPGTPTFSNIAGTSATASWAAASDNVGVTGYRYSLNGGAFHTLGNVTSVSLSGLTCVTSYTFTVQARDAAGNWGASSSGSFATPDGCAPSAPGTPTFSNIASTSATAHWGAASDNIGVTGYRYRVNGGTLHVLGNVTSVVLSGLTCATNYSVAVEARDAAGNWGSASSASFKTLDGCPPGAPGTPAFTSITLSSATASWGAASDNVGVTGYQYRLNGGTWQQLGKVTSVGLSGLSAATQYTFEIQARDAAGNWSTSASSSFVTALPAITLPSSYYFSSRGTAHFWLEADGDLWHNMSSGIGQDFGDWLSPKSGMSQFEVLATKQGGTDCRGTFNVWLPFDRGRDWYSQATSTSSRSCTVRLQIRRIGTTTVLGTGTVRASASP